MEEMDTDLPTSVQQAAETKLLQSLLLHNRTRLMRFPLTVCLSHLGDEPAVQHSDSLKDIVMVPGCMGRDSQLAFRLDPCVKPTGECN